MNVTIRRLHTVASVCLIHYVFLRARSDKRDSSRWLTDISVTDKSACLREFYCCTAAVRRYKSHVRTRVSHFDREARPLATSKHTSANDQPLIHLRIASVSVLWFQFPPIGMSWVRIESIFHCEKDIEIVKSGNWNEMLWNS